MIKDQNKAVLSSKSMLKVNDPHVWVGISIEKHGKNGDLFSFLGRFFYFC